MDARLKHTRRLSLFGLSTPQQPDSGEVTPIGTSECSLVWPAPPASSEGLASKAADRKPSLARKLSKKEKKKTETKGSHPPSSFSNFATQSVTSLVRSRSRYSDASLESGPTTSLRKNRSLNLKIALTTIFVPKPSRKKVTGILNEASERGRTNNRKSGIGYNRAENVKSYGYISRSPSPPSPEIRPPSGLGQIASSVNLSAYIEEEREASLLASRRESFTPSVDISAASLRSDAALTSVSDAGKTSEAVENVEYDIRTPVAARIRTPPSQDLIDVLELCTANCDSSALARLSRTCRAFSKITQNHLYTEIDSDRCRTSEARRALLGTLASRPELAILIKKLRWVFLATSSVPSNSMLHPKRSIPRRAPTVSVSSSPEESVLHLVLSSAPNLTTLDLVHPPMSLLEAFLPKSPSLRRSRSAASSPVSPADSTRLQLLPPSLLRLTSLALSGRTTLSTAFGDVLVSFFEHHPNIVELSLPDVFCLPMIVSLARSPSSSASNSPGQSPHRGIPPIPPLPGALLLHKEREDMPIILPNLRQLKAPLSLATQLVPGRPLHAVDIELATSVYEGMRPADVAQSLAAAEAIAIARTPRTPVSADNLSWKAARQARRAGLSPASPNSSKSPSLKELMIRCTAKVDARTIVRVLNAIGTEMGSQLERLAIGWSGIEDELHSQLSQSLGRFTALQRLELSSLIMNSENEWDFDDLEDHPREMNGRRSGRQGESLADLRAGMALEQRLVEQWCRLCPKLSYMEFASHRVWKAR